MEGTPIRIPLVDIEKMHEPIRDEILAAMTEVLDSASYINGSYVEKFESELAEYVGAKRAVGVSSGGTSVGVVVTLAVAVAVGGAPHTAPRITDTESLRLFAT